MTRPLLVLAIGAALWTAAPGRAEACVYGGCEGLLVAVGIGVLVVGVGDIAVLGVDLTYALRGRWLPADQAVVNLFWGGLNVVGGAVLAALGAGGDPVGWGLGVVGAGAIMIADGILSLALRDDELEAPIGLALAPVRGGASLTLAARF